MGEYTTPCLKCETNKYMTRLLSLLIKISAYVNAKYEKNYLTHP